jgi:hypothetical protein
MGKRKLVIGAGAVALVIALVAIFVMPGLMAVDGSNSDGDIGSASSDVRRPAGRVMETVFDDGNGPVASRIEILPSPDLPERAPDTDGVFVKRVDNSVFVGTGNVNLDLHLEQAADGSIQPIVSLSSDGPEVEVVITRDTVLYLDVTEIPGEGGVPGKAGDVTVTQKVRVIDSLDDLKGNAELQVWGTRRGDRVVADTLIYRVVSPNLGL